MVTVGIDPSFSKTGLSIIRDFDELADCVEIVTTTKDGHHGERCLKIVRAIENAVLRVLRNGERLSVFIEKPCNLKGEAIDLVALFWYIVNTLQSIDGVSVYHCSPDELYKFLTGKGRTAAVNKIVAVQKKYGHLIPPEFVVDYDQAGGIEKHKDVYDAIGLAALGDCYLGGDGYTGAEKAAVAKVKPL